MKRGLARIYRGYMRAMVKGTHTLPAGNPARKG
jgi:hypothetical protein